MFSGHALVKEVIFRIRYHALYVFWSRLGNLSFAGLDLIHPLGD